MRITKEKNWLVLINDENKTNKFDMETGNILGKLGKPVKKLSPDIMSNALYMGGTGNATNNYAWAITYAIQNERLDLVLKADKIISLGLMVDMRELSSVNDSTFNEIKLTKNIVDFLKAQNNGLFSIRAIKKYTLFKDLTTDEMTMVNRFGDTIPDTIKLNLIELKKCLSWLSYLVNIEKVEMMNEFSYNLNRYFVYAKEIEKTDIFQKGFYKNLCLYKFEFDTQKDVRLYRKIKENQENKKLEFTNERFTIIVPTTAEQFKDEGEQQRNCVGYSYHESIANGNYNIVFLRLVGNPTKSYITLQIRPRDRQIVQAKIKSNYEPSKSDMILVNEYQAYLKK